MSIQIVLPVVLGVTACGKTETPNAGPTQSQAASAGATSAASQPYQDKAAFVAAL